MSPSPFPTGTATPIPVPSSSASPTAAGEFPSQSNEFVASIGVNTQFGNHTAPWNNPATFNKLAELGISNVSDGSGPVTWPIGIKVWPASGVPQIGWNDNPANATCGGWNGYTPDSVITELVPRAFANNWNAGIPHTFLYELADTPSEGCVGNQGLLDVYGNPKPQYTALRSMLNLLSDPGAVFTPTPYSWKLSGQTANVNHLLLQKRDGSLWLLLWLEVSGWSQNVEREIPSQSVVLTLPKTPSSVVLYQSYNDGSLASMPLSASTQITVPVNDAMAYVKIQP